MNKKLLKNVVCFLTLLVLFSPVFVLAQVDSSVIPGEFDEGGYLPGLKINTQTTDLPAIVVNIINIVLGLLALIAVIIILIGGFEWMTAGGNEEKVETAKKRLKYGVIGLVIIFLAYAIAAFVISNLSSDQITG